MLRTLFGLGPKVDIGRLIADGATLVDVRTASEYAGGHPSGSLNIPLDKLEQQLHRVPKDRPVITCCASGMRSRAAADILRDHGYTAYNGGAWMKLQAIRAR
ncbi:MAG: rhodanese-like domain-containing protein [Flavobacteriales bacterium]|nr:rhodanese-like domain-containing protein [Flavobacteriales bacterium]